VKFRQKLTVITNKVIASRLFDISEHDEVVIKISQSSVVTQIELGGLTAYTPGANFPQCIDYVPEIMKIGCQWTRVIC